jgi:hypothetical protein
MKRIALLERRTALARPATIPRARVAETGQKRIPIILKAKVEAAALDGVKVREQLTKLGGGPFTDT